MGTFAKAAVFILIGLMVLTLFVPSVRQLLTRVRSECSRRTDRDYQERIHGRTFRGHQGDDGKPRHRSEDQPNKTQDAVDAG